METSCSINQRQQTRRHPDEVNEIGRNSHIQHNPPQAAQATQPTLGYVSGGSRGGAREARASPLFLDQTEVRRAEKKFFETAPPLFSGSGWPAAPASFPYLKVWIRHCMFTLIPFRIAFVPTGTTMWTATVQNCNECDRNLFDMRPATWRRFAPSQKT